MPGHIQPQKHLLHVINAPQDIIQTTALLIVKNASLEPMLRFTEVLYA
jgi:hypothetical protein